MTLSDRAPDTVCLRNIAFKFGKRLKTLAYRMLGSDARVDGPIRNIDSHVNLHLIAWIATLYMSRNKVRAAEYSLC